MFTLQEAYQAVINREEFAVTNKGGLVSFDYHAYLEDTFHTDPRTAFIRSQFRGVTFDSDSGELLSLPFHKFYNVNEKEETAFDLLKDFDATIYEKLDGTMIHFFMHKGQLRASSRSSSFTFHANLALKFVERNSELKSRIIESVESGLTPIFEYCAPSNQILVHYPKARMVYLSSRSRTTGDYVQELGFPDVPIKYNYKFSEILNHRHYEDFEGYVCYFNNQIVKVKNKWYVETKFKEENLFTIFNKSVLNLLKNVISDNSFDDLISISPKEYQTVLRQLQQEYLSDYLNESKRIIGLYNQIKDQFDLQEQKTRYDFVKMVEAVSAEDLHLIMGMFDGKDTKEMIDKKLLKHTYKNRSERITSYLEGYE